MSLLALPPPRRVHVPLPVQWGVVVVLVLVSISWLIVVRERRHEAKVEKKQELIDQRVRWFRKTPRPGGIPVPTRGMVGAPAGLVEYRP